MNMKQWSIEYSAKSDGGREKKYKTIITAPTIRAAMDKVETKIITPMRIATHERVVIRKMEMIGDNTF